MLKLSIELMERGLLPDWLIRRGIRQLCKERLQSLSAELQGRTKEEMLSAYANSLKQEGLAKATKEANTQHYEVPADFFLTVLGSSRKYSCTFWDQNAKTLDDAERVALNLTIERAQLKDGMNILELGCGWGSLSLQMARRFPNSKILAISNSRTQREFIESIAAKENLTNLQIKTLDLSNPNNFAQIPAKNFDRALSVEMFEHFKNYQRLLSQIAHCLKPDGKLFVHIFTHQKYSYPFETEGADNWMGKYFFTGGQMPAKDLLLEFQEDLKLENQWDWNGTHYQKTADAWLENLDRERDRVISLFEKNYGPAEARRWVERWRVFFLSCSELFGYKNGSEWGVTHYLFSHKQ